MANAASMAGAPTRGGSEKSQSRNGKAGVRARPFVQASLLHREPVGYDISVATGASVQILPDIQVPAYGFLRAILLVVSTTAGAGTGVTATADNPFNALQNIVLQEPNGSQICNFPSGYDLYLANKFGGYEFQNDPRTSENFTVGIGTGANFKFLLRIPVEVSIRDALGALPNQNSGALFRVKMNLSPTATLFGGTVSTPPTVRIQAFAEEWDQPEDYTDGVPNAKNPPALNTTQFWTRQDFPVNAGNLNIRLTRMGNYIRNLIFVLRDSAGARAASDANFPPLATLYYDTRPLDTISREMWLEQIMSRYGYGGKLGNTNSAAGTVTVADSGMGRENSVWPYDFCHEFDRSVGAENRDLWLPTLSSTRFEVGGTWTGTNQTLSVLTNDVTITDNVWM